MTQPFFAYFSAKEHELFTKKLVFTNPTEAISSKAALFDLSGVEVFGMEATPVVPTTLQSHRPQ